MRYAKGRGFHARDMNEMKKQLTLPSISSRLSFDWPVPTRVPHLFSACTVSAHVGMIDPRTNDIEKTEQTEVPI